MRDEDGREQLGDIVTNTTTGRFEAIVPTWCGESLVKLVWTNTSCDRVVVFSVQTGDCVESDLEVTLFWNSAGDNLDLHLIRPSGRLNDAEDDCNSWTCVAESPDWGPVGSQGDPMKDVDVRDGGGPETIVLVTAEEGAYQVIVDRPSTLPRTALRRYRHRHHRRSAER